MARRGATCTWCDTDFLSGERGALPMFCQDCRTLRLRFAGRSWKHRNADRMTAYARAYNAANPRDHAAYWQELKARDGERIRARRRKVYLERQRDTNTERVAAYRAANPGKHAEIENRRRARLLEQFVAPVDPVAIRRRDSGLCGICGFPVNPDAQSLDHIIPLALGGTHEPGNVQLAHPVCNSRKGARLVA